jgi:acyl carrier protein
MSSVVEPDQMTVHIMDVIASFGPDRALVRFDASFEELDIDSLDLVELAQIVEEDYGVALQQDDLKQIKTVGEAIALVRARLGS